MLEARQELNVHVHKSVLSPSTKQSVHSTGAEASTVHCNDPTVVASGPTLGPAQQKELWLRCSQLRVLRNVGTQHNGLHANLLPYALRAGHRLGTQFFKFSFVGRDAIVCVNSMRVSPLVISLDLTRSPCSHRKKKENSKLKLFGYVSFSKKLEKSNDGPCVEFIFLRQSQNKQTKIKLLRRSVIACFVKEFL